MLDKSKKKNTYFCESNFITNVVVISIENYENFFNKTKKSAINVKKLKKKIFKKFHQYIFTFDSKKINKFLSYKK